MQLRIYAYSANDDRAYKAVFTLDDTVADEEGEARCVDEERDKAQGGQEND